MKGYCLLWLSILSCTCQGTNTTFSWASVSHEPAASDTHGNVGDYVAAGLGISTSGISSTTENLEESAVAEPSISTDEISSSFAISADFKGSLSTDRGLSTGDASSTLATATSGNRTQDIDSNSQSQTRSGETAILTTAPTLGGSPEDVHVTTNISDTPSATNCWNSWLDYWSASSLNQVTYIATLSSVLTETRTELRDEKTLIPTSSWESFVDTAIYSTLSTIYSDGYPISVSVSYDTVTYSNVGWAEYTIWSSLSEFHTTFTETFTRESLITTTQSTTQLPTPGCDLPAAASECSTQWSSYINDDDHWHYYNDFDDPDSAYFPGTPDCTQAMITGDWCTTMASFYFARETMYGQADDVGWKTANGTSYFPASKSLAPGCSLGCQQCSITGETVQLYYWPPSTATLVEDGAETATLTPFARNDSSLRTVEIDGTTLTSPTMYISYDILHAANSCGAVGKTYRNTVLPLLNTNHLFSLEPVILYHGYGQGFRTSSFNLEDLVEPISDSVYEKQGRCQISHISHLVHGPPGPFSCARTEPYAPIIGVPPEVRALDPEWVSCQAWYGGLFDPPKALQPVDAIALPTMPAAATSPAATPQPTLDSGLPAKTSAPATTPARPETTQSKKVAHPTNLAPNRNPDEPAKDPHATPNVKDSTVNSAEGAPENVLSNTAAKAQPDLSEDVATIVSIFLTQGAHSTQIAENPPLATPESGRPSHIAHGVVFSAGSNVHTVLSSQGLIALDGTPLQSGEATVISGQTISAESGTVWVNGIPHHHSVLEQPSTTDGVFTVSGQEHTAVQRASGAIGVDGESYTFGAVAAVGGATVTVGSEGVIIGGTAIPYAELPASTKQDSVFTINGHAYSVDSKSGSLHINGEVAVIGSKITINDDVLTIGSVAINVDSATFPFGDMRPAEPTVATAASVVVSGETLTVFKEGTDAIFAGTKVKVGQVTTISGIPISVGNEGIVVDSSTATFHEMDRSTSKTGDAMRIDSTGRPTAISADQSEAEISNLDPKASATGTHATDNAGSVFTVDGTGYTATAVSGRSDAVVLQGHTLSIGGSGVAIAGYSITKGPNGISIINSATSAAAASAINTAEFLLTIDGKVYTATPVPGSSDAIVLQGHTLSVGGSGVTIGGRLITKGSNGVSVATSTSLAASTTSELSLSTTDMPESSTVQQRPAAPSKSESEQSVASNLNHRFGFVLLCIAMLILALMNL
ncbi:hypothetical protein Q7P37_007370 [Cladosporium fusiforme]